MRTSFQELGMEQPCCPKRDLDQTKANLNATKLERLSWHGLIGQARDWLHSTVEAACRRIQYLGDGMVHRTSRRDCRSWKKGHFALSSHG